MPTINFALGSATVNWDGGNSIGTDQRAGLENQARRNVTGLSKVRRPQPRSSPNIVDFETRCSPPSSARLGVGRLDVGWRARRSRGAGDDAEIAGRFDLFDAWTGHDNPRRAQIARGQALFNGVNASGGSCRACHNSANDGTNIDSLLFDIRTASASARTPDLPLYTFRNRTTGETRQLTDAGRGNSPDSGVISAVSRRRRCVRLPHERRTSITASPRQSRT